MSESTVHISDHCPACEYNISAITSSRCPECGAVITTDEPIDRYRERQFELKREFTLYKDRIVTRGNRLLGSHFEVPIKLTDLNPDHSTFFIRPQSFKYGFAIFLFGGIFTWFFIVASTMNRSGPLLSVIAAVIGLAGLLFMVCTARQIQFIRFHAAANPASVLLDIARHGPDISRFDDFVTKLKHQITAVHQQKQ